LLIYPEGNWVIATDDSPSFIIGRTSYGKPILDRLLSPTTTVPHGDRPRVPRVRRQRASVVDVEFPIDVVVMSGGELRQQRFEPDDLAATHDSWQQHLQDAMSALPIGWAAASLPKPTEGP
jgi:putative proteasome-type protease